MSGAGLFTARHAAASVKTAEGLHLHPRQAVPASPGGDIVGKVLQADFGARPHHANRAHDPTARRALLRPEYMLDTSAIRFARSCADGLVLPVHSPMASRASTIALHRRGPHGPPNAT